MSSATPGRKNRPSTIFTLLRTSSALGETPRTCTLASVPVARSGKGATTTVSGLTSGPSAVRATPGASSSTFTSSSVTAPIISRSEEHTSELQSRLHLVCRLLLEKKKKKNDRKTNSIHVD